MIIMISDGLKTRVSVIPLERSTIDENGYIAATGKEITVKSVKDHEDELVTIQIPSGEEVTAKASDLISAIQKCVM